eukprot:359154-Chlamydomonas_euryale.AAC.1
MAWDPHEAGTAWTPAHPAEMRGSGREGRPPLAPRSWQGGRLRKQRSAVGACRGGGAGVAWKGQRKRVETAGLRRVGGKGVARKGQRKRVETAGLRKVGGKGVVGTGVGERGWRQQSSAEMLPIYGRCLLSAANADPEGRTKRRGARDSRPRGDAASVLERGGKVVPGIMIRSSCRYEMVRERGGEGKSAREPPVRTEQEGKANSGRGL